MEETGKVIKTKKNRATVLIELPQNCDACEFSKFCRIDKNGREIVCINNKGAKVGDVVQLYTTKRNLVIATFLNFVFPLLVLIVGVVIGKKIWQTEGAGFMLGMTLTFLYFFVFLFIDKKLLKGDHFLPEIVVIKQKKQ
jgi:positive regulator of sigma E activity